MNPGNFEDLIHNENYLADYYSALITADSLITTPVHGTGHGLRETQSLNGWWSFTLDPYDTFLRAKWYRQAEEDGARRAREEVADRSPARESARASRHELPRDFDFASWERVRVPSCWNTADERYYYYEGPAVYTRTFDWKPAVAGTESAVVGTEPVSDHAAAAARVILRFGAVQYDAKVFLNGEFMGMHLGGSTPFCIDVTGRLRRHNRLTVSVNNRRESDRVPMTNTDWFNYGGIYRDVELLTVPESYLQHASCALVPDAGFRRIRVDLTVAGSKQSGRARVRIPELGVDEALEVRDGRGGIDLSAKPELWSPDHPRLYDVLFSYGTDEVRDRIGFRELRVEGGELLLNGRPTFFAGVACHEESVDNGKAVTQVERTLDLENARELGCRYMRLAHYPHSERTAELADARGMLLWEEIPVYWAIDFENPATYQDAENQLRELILRDRNRASVAIWSVGNENPDTDSRLAFMSGLAKAARRIDDTRLVSAACLVDHVANRIADRLTEHLDIIGLNEYYGWYNPDFELLPDLLENSRPGKPVFITEFGAGAKTGHHGTTGELFTEECQAEVYRRQIEVFRRTSYIKGISPWILYDFRSPRRLNGLQLGYNLKGLMDRDRRTPKLAFNVLREFYRSLGDGTSQT